MVTRKGQKEGVATSQQGEFFFKALPEGPVSLVLSKPGFVFEESYEREVSGVKSQWKELSAKGVECTVKVETYKQPYSGIKVVLLRDGQEEEVMTTP